MADKYYILSKDVGDGPYLIGELTRLGKSEYQFRYLIKGYKQFPKAYETIVKCSKI